MILIRKFESYMLDHLGYSSFGALFASTFSFKVLTSTVKIGAIMAFMQSVFTFTEMFVTSYLGLPILLFMAFLILISLEFWTGIARSKTLGIAIQSKLLARMGGKILVYATILFILNTFLKNSITIDNKEIAAYMIALKLLYGTIYWFFFNIICLQLLWSVFENLKGISDYKEVVFLKKILDYKISRFFTSIMEKDKHKHGDSESK